LCVRSTFNRGEELIIVVNHLVDHKPFQSWTVSNPSMHSWNPSPCLTRCRHSTGYWIKAEQFLYPVTEYRKTPKPITNWQLQKPPW
jgi:hypothetical protein